MRDKEQNKEQKGETMIKGVRDTVTKLLIENPHLRDDDEKLLANVYWQRISSTLVHKLSPDQLLGIKLFLKEVADGKMPNYQSVSRCRRKLQESDPTLRGKLYGKRHEATSFVKDELKFWD